VDGLQIVLCEQVERAEHLIVLDVKGPCSLEITLECDEVGWLDVELLGGADLAEVLVVLGREPRCPPRAASVVVVRVGIHVLLRLVMMVLLGTVVEELRHGEGGAVDGEGDDNKAKQRGCWSGRWGVGGEEDAARSL